jgi:hypothetical protein
MVHYLRVIHAHKNEVSASILIDKIDRSQGNFTGYAYRGKQKIYVPYLNPVDTSVHGYLDLVPTDEVLLSWENGTIKKLFEQEYLDRAIVSADSIAKSTVTGVSLAGSDVTITGTTFVSVEPDVTYVLVTNPSTGVTQSIPSSVFTSGWTATQIVFPDSLIGIGVIGSGWKVAVKANSKVSAQFTIA